MTSQSGVGAGVSAIQSFETWLQGPLWPGIRFPLNGIAAGEVVYRERVTANEGVWVQFSIPLVSQAVLSAVLPCTIWAETTVAGQALTSGQNLINAGGNIATLVPYAPGRYVFQSLGPYAPSPLVVESSWPVGAASKSRLLTIMNQPRATPPTHRSEPRQYAFSR